MPGDRYSRNFDRVVGPVGINKFLAGTGARKISSKTFYAPSLPLAPDDGNGNLRYELQPGVVLATITSGPGTGMVGAFQTAGTAEIQRLTKAGTVSGGSFTLTFGGQTTAAIAWDAVAADVKAALVALSNLDTYDVTVTGGPIASTPFDITFKQSSGILTADVGQLTADATLLTGSGAGVTPSTTTPGVAGSGDGRGVAANIVGINETYLPWQLQDHDMDVACVYECAAVQSWCYTYNGAGTRIALPDGVAADMFGKKWIDIRFPVA